MKKIFIIRDTLANKISYYHLLLFLVCLPFDRFYTELILISFSIHTLLHIKRNPIAGLQLKKVLLLQAVFLLSVACLFYAYDKSDGFNKPGRQSAILLFPILFSLTRLDLEKYKLQLFSGFALTCTLIIAYLYFDALHTIFFNKLALSELFSPAFINHNFSEPIEMHATYLSMYACFSLVYMVYLLLKTKEIIYKVFYVFCCLILTAGLIQLGSKAVLIAAIVAVNLIMPMLISVTKKRILYLSVSVTASLVVIIGITTGPIFKTRYLTGFKEDLHGRGFGPSIPEPRMARWESAVKLINRSPVIGYGTGAEVPVLKQQYYRDKLYIAYYNELNAHNEYLSIALNSGYTGLLLFLFVLYAGFTIAYKKKDVLCMSFLIIIIITSFSENILDLNKGIFFYSFFFSLFLLSNNKSRLTYVSNKEAVAQATFQ